MRNKNLGLKATLLVGSMVGMSLSFTLSASFTIDLGAGIQAISDEAITNNIIPVHFSDNGNDFGGFLYIQDGDNYNVSERVTFEGGSEYLCQQQVKGFYYNSERGERLWPLDEQTWWKWHNNDQDGLMISGGLYTRCVSKELAAALDECADGSGNTAEDEAQCEADARDLYGTLYGYYGVVLHKYDNQEFGLIAGAQYTGNGTWLTIDRMRPLAESFIRYDNQYPVGLLYDYNGGVGFVGCEFLDKSSGLRKFVQKFNSGYSLSEMFEEDGANKWVKYVGGDNIDIKCNDVGYAANSLINLIIEGLIGMGQGTDLSLMGNQINPKMQYFASSNVNNTVLINYARKKAESLCRGKWIDYEERNKMYGSDWGYGSWREWYKELAEDWGQKYARWVKNYEDRNGSDKRNDLICLDGNGDDRPIIAEPGKTYIVRGKINIFVPAMEKFNDDNYYYDIFVMDREGNILLDNVKREEKKVFTKDGFISGTGKVFDEEDPENEEVFNNKVRNAISSEAIVNEEGEPKYIGNYTGDDVAVGAFIKGNFIVNGHLWHVCNDELLLNNAGWCQNENEVDRKISNRYFVYGKFTTNDSFSDLENLFSWRCINGISSDGDEKYCPQSLQSREWINPYENAFLVVIDQNYDSPLFKS